MSSGDIILVIVALTAVGVDFTNGLHDTANVVATSISTRAVEAFISLKVAATIGQGFVASAR